MFNRMKKFFLKNENNSDSLQNEKDQTLNLKETSPISSDSDTELRRKFIFGTAVATGLAATEIVQAATWKKVSTASGSASGNVDVQALSGNTTLDSTHNGKLLSCTGTITLTLTSAVTLANGWWCYISNIGTGVITLSSGSANLYQIGGRSSWGVTSLTVPDTGTGNNLYNNGTVMVVCDGTNFNVNPIATAHGSQTFTASGTWVCPVGINTVWVTGIGGGGAGAASAAGTSNPTGGGGGSGDMVVRQRLSVVAGTSYTVTVGAAGGASSFGALLTLAAGGAGSTATGGGGGGSRGSDGNNGDNASSSGGNGGAGLFGGAARGGIAANGTAAPANTGAGGGGAGNSTIAYTGGAGGSGIVIVEW